ncbi:hypothetical protein JW921_08480, partial [Candidatus Fermentibacterales bacterium]|nr:hypothetical protein [Candidatus Fermentibacterales bacterium]
MTQRTLPGNYEAERSVIGAILVDPELAVEIFSVLKADDFLDRKHRAIYEACVELDSRSSLIDLVTINAELERSGRLEDAGGLEYLAALTEEIPTASSVKSHMEIVRDKALLRKLLAASNENMREVYESTDDAKTVLDRAETRVFRISESVTTSDFVALKDLVDKGIASFERLRDSQTYITGVPSGFADL